MPRLSRPLLLVLFFSLLFCARVTAQGALVLEEVLVTAQKKTESLAETPMTIEVITGEQLAEFSSFSLEDLSNMSAGLAISGSGFDTDIATRGLGTNLNAAVTPRVTVYLDQASIGQERGLFSGLFDLERFELLRGPQGTLYGRSSPAGAITISSRSPSLTAFEGYAQQTFAERDTTNTQFGLSLPIVRDALGLRIAGLLDDNRREDIDNVTRADQNNNRTNAYRAVLVWEPEDWFNARLAYHDLWDRFDIDMPVEGQGYGYDDRVALGEYRSTMRNDTEVAILELNARLPNDWELTSVTSHQDNVIERYYDFDGSQITGENQHVVSDVTGGWTSELRLSSQGNDRWDWTTGLFYYDSDSLTSVNVETWRALTPDLRVLALTDGPADISGDTLGVFLHNALHLSAAGTLTLGLRYSETEQTAQQPFTVDAFFVFPDNSQLPAARLEWEGVLPENRNYNDDAVTGTLKYQHDLNDDLMAYVSLDRGWRPGAANISAGVQPPEFGAFDGESSDNLELGFKWTLLGGRGLLNGSVYYQLYEDFQYQAQTIDYRQFGVGSNAGAIDQASPVLNVDEVEAYGFDSDFTFLISSDWLLRAALSYNRTRFSQAAEVPCTSDEPLPDAPLTYNTCDLDGERAGQMPEWSANIGSEYTRPLGSGNKQWYVRGLINSESRYYSQSLSRDLDNYITLDLFAGLRAQEGNWDAMLWMKNVSDTSALLRAQSLPLVPDYSNGGQVESGLIWARRQIQPRTLGLTLRLAF